MFCSSGLSSPPNGRPYSIPTRRSAVASARIAPNAVPLRVTDLRSVTLRLSARAPLDLSRRCATDKVGDGGAADEDGVHARPLQRDDVVARRRLEIGDRELAGGNIREQVEDPLQVLLVVFGLARREQEDLRLDPLERCGERLVVVDVDDDLQAELGRAGV